MSPIQAAERDFDVQPRVPCSVVCTETFLETCQLRVFLGRLHNSDTACQAQPRALPCLVFHHALCLDPELASAATIWQHLAMAKRRVRGRIEQVSRECVTLPRRLRARDQLCCSYGAAMRQLVT